MSQTTRITCDDCGKDIASTDFVPKFRLVLAAESLPHVGRTMSAMLIYPPLDSTKHFCGLRCLKGWADRTAG